MIPLIQQAQQRKNRITVRCEGINFWGKKCNKILLLREAIKIIKDKKNIYCCPDCFPKMYEALSYGKAKIKKEELEKGFINKHPDDIKHYLWKWTKHQ